MKKCGYCDFLSFDYNAKQMDDYIRHLFREIDMYGQVYHNCKVKSIFFGGGTPSLLTGPQMQSIMERLYKWFTLTEDAEISMEANPGTLSKTKLEAYVAAGINRISLGVQTLNDVTLKTLDRIHDTQAVYKSVDMIKAAGIKNFNMDLMFGLPGQTMDQLMETLQKMIELSPTHISAYSLKIEERTPFYEAMEKGEIIPQSDEMDRRMYHAIEKALAEAGFLQYEISNFAKPGFACRHNLVYWEKEDYIGIGLGAHGCLKQTRYHNVEDFDQYEHLLDRCQMPVAETTIIDEKEDRFEYIMLNLRLNKGLDKTSYQKRFAASFEDNYKETVESLIADALMQKTETSYILTEKGRDLSNQVFLKFLD